MNNAPSSFLQYKLLLYLSQQKQVTAAKIYVGFAFTVSLTLYIKKAAICLQD